MYQCEKGVDWSIMETLLNVAGEVVFDHKLKDGELLHQNKWERRNKSLSFTGI